MSQPGFCEYLTCRFRSHFRLTHTDPNQGFNFSQTCRFRFRSPIGRPTFNFTYCFPFLLFHVFYSHVLSHALMRASPYCSPSHVIVPSAHCFSMYLASSDYHLETLILTSCLQVSPHILRLVDTSLNTSFVSSSTCQA